MTKYKKREDYEEFLVNYKGEILAIACCDCGLVHQYAFHVYRGGKLGMAAKRENRATAQLRRYDYGYLQQGRKKNKYALVRE